MNLSLDNYLSITSEPLENDYISEQFKGYQIAFNGESYSLAIMAYHLIFLSFYNQVLYKTKKFLPKEHYLSMTLFDQERMTKFRIAVDPTDYAHRKNYESTMFELLDIFPGATETISLCKERVKYRNSNLAHVSYVVIDESIFDAQIEKYNKCALEITKLYNKELKRIFEEWVSGLDDEDISYLTKDDIESNFLTEYKLSLVDITFLRVCCMTKDSDRYKKVNEILSESYHLIL